MIILLQVKNGEKNVILKCQKNEKQTPQIKCLLLPLMFLSWVLSLDSWPWQKKNTQPQFCTTRKDISVFAHSTIAAERKVRK